MRIGCMGSGWRLCARRALVGATGLLLVVISGTASAITLTPFTGDDSEVEIDLVVDDGKILMTATVSSGMADIRGIFFDVADDSLLSGLTISGPDVTDVAFGNVVNLGLGSNLLGGGSPCPCDVGVEIGRPGLRGGGDDFQTTTIVIMHETLDLDLSFLAGQAIGVRLTSVGPDEGSRRGSSKLGGVVPEPSTGALTLVGLSLLAGRRRPLRARG